MQYATAPAAYDACGPPRPVLQYARPSTAVASAILPHHGSGERRALTSRHTGSRSIGAHRGPEDPERHRTTDTVRRRPHDARRLFSEPPISVPRAMHPRVRHSTPDSTPRLPDHLQSSVLCQCPRLRVPGIDLPVVGEVLKSELCSRKLICEPSFKSIR